MRAQRAGGHFRSLFSVTTVTDNSQRLVDILVYLQLQFADCCQRCTVVAQAPVSGVNSVFTTSLHVKFLSPRAPNPTQNKKWSSPVSSRVHCSMDHT